MGYRQTVPVLILGALALGVLLVAGGERPKRELFVVVIEPKVMVPAVARAIPGAKETVLAAARETEFGGLRYYDKEEFESMGLTWEAFLERGRRSADQLMGTLEVEYIRDEREVIQYALIRSENHRTAGVVLREAFRKEFRETLGPELVVVIPDRFTVIVFPKLGGGYQGIGPKMIEKFDEAVYPVSVELFQIDAKRGLSAIGGFSRSAKEKN